MTIIIPPAPPALVFAITYPQNELISESINSIKDKSIGFNPCCDNGDTKEVVTEDKNKNKISVSKKWQPKVLDASSTKERAIANEDNFDEDLSSINPIEHTENEILKPQASLNQTIDKPMLSETQKKDSSLTEERNNAIARSTKLLAIASESENLISANQFSPISNDNANKNSIDISKQKNKIKSIPINVKKEFKSHIPLNHTPNILLSETRKNKSSLAKKNNNLVETESKKLILANQFVPINSDNTNKHSTSISEQKNKTESIPIPVEEDFYTSETILPESVKINAEALGKPISVGESYSESSSDDNNNSNQLINNVQNKSKAKKTTRLLTKARRGITREFNVSLEMAQDNPTPTENNQTSDQVTIPIDTTTNVVEVVADEQEYLDQQQIIKAKGNVVIRFSNGVLSADEVKINLPNRIAVAEGDVYLKRGDQTLRGNRFEYYFVQDEGVIFNANGEIYQPNIGRDFAEAAGNNPIPQQPLSWQIEKNQPLQRVSSAEGYQFVVGSIRDYGILAEASGNTAVSTAGGGQVNRLRFQAERVDFDSDGWHATNIRFTNDPFSPPELEVVADTAKLRNIAPLVDELTTTNSRLVFDRTVSVPIFQDRLVFDRRKRNPGLFNIGFDGEERGGLYIERTFDIYVDDKIEFTLTPQLLVQRSFFPESFEDLNADNPDDNGGVFNPSSYGLIGTLNVNFSDRTQLESVADFSSLNLENIDDRLRASLRLNQKLGELNNPHTLSFQFNYRERLFNGSLGFQTVQSSVGAVITSPYIPLGNSGLGLIYQGSVQNVTADTDRQELLASVRDDNLVNLTRFQTAALISGGFLLWAGEALPPTREEGLKYTSTPVAPYLKLNTSLTGVNSYYSSGDVQPTLTGAIGIEGQLGHFSAPFLDYTGFNISYRQGLRGGQSPFFFDRFSDQQVLSVGLTQQLYGPIRAGIQTFYNIETNKEISTDYVLEYSRRTYNIMLRYNPVLEIGSVNLRISDFNWEGNPIPLEGTGIKPVIDGIKR